MQEITIDQEIKELLPALDKDTREGLEKSLLEYGCIYPLVVWRGILIEVANHACLLMACQNFLKKVEKFSINNVIPELFTQLKKLS